MCFFSYFFFKFTSKFLIVSQFAFSGRFFKAVCAKQREVNAGTRRSSLREFQVLWDKIFWRRIVILPLRIVSLLEGFKHRRRPFNNFFEDKKFPIFFCVNPSVVHQHFCTRQMGGARNRNFKKNKKISTIFTACERRSFKHLLLLIPSYVSPIIWPRTDKQRRIRLVLRLF